LSRDAGSAFNRTSLWPFADITLTFEAAGLNQDLNTGSEHFVGDPESEFLALLYGIPDDARHLVPVRSNDRKDDLIDLRLGSGGRKPDLVPSQRAVDCGKLTKRKQVGKSLKKRLYQLGIELDSELVNRSGVLILVCSWFAAALASSSSRAAWSR
jgi:hypothetical protein